MVLAAKLGQYETILVAAALIVVIGLIWRLSKKKAGPEEPPSEVDSEMDDD
ncbi:MAG: hypothetical protein J7M08_05400 [Planctomycetes bacterium]|nr:hypothetical protein [Planctomycetota bacterium]